MPLMSQKITCNCEVLALPLLWEDRMNFCSLKFEILNLFRAWELRFRILTK